MTADGKRMKLADIGSSGSTGSSSARVNSTVIPPPTAPPSAGSSFSSVPNSENLVYRDDLAAALANLNLQNMVESTIRAAMSTYDERVQRRIVSVEAAQHVTNERLQQLIDRVDRMEESFVRTTAELNVLRRPLPKSSRIRSSLEKLTLVL
jgi:hypothetical protein